MKYLIGAATAIILLAVSLTSCAPSNTKTETFKVWGNCGMCKETIEASLKTEGVVKANWNKDSKMIAITYDTLKTTLDEIHTKIAASGYDTEKLKGDDEAYSNLHECCQYKRKE